MPLQLRLHLDLQGRSAAAQARRAARGHLVMAAESDGEYLPPLALDTALLLISELVTNAVRHTGGGCLLEVRLASEGIDIEVTDTSDEEPEPRRPDRRGEGGWGWHLVNRLGTDVAIRHHAAGGKTIHVRVPREGFAAQ
ncbi:MULTISPECIES: ATP-binding protein [Streptomyces]|uniref:ATP-binding protein n=1 Tax=Streptomyces yangpuensis TaxID=1648182 RepID=A0ABY5Q4U1_9ACTN|nr:MULTISPECIES: ATP-binding protein [Streptomyces]MBZ9599724.1 ATP-binding protein [Streptomyces erythrochromogenes]UUY51289.1 ATP-binding protein [Streptomyces yangpuensis]